MRTLEKLDYLNELFDHYASLLTEKQINYFKLYYHEDFTLQEIADTYLVSRNAIYDQLKKVESHLKNYEEKLKLNEKKHQRVTCWNNYRRTKEHKYLDLLRKVDEV